MVGLVLFGWWLSIGANNSPMEFLCIPFLVWVAFRFGQREAATASAALSGLALWGTLHGFGPFARATPNESLLLLQAFMGTISVTTVASAAVVADRRAAYEQALRLVERINPLLV